MRFSMKPDDSMRVEKAYAGHVPLLILRPQKPRKNTPGVLWIHGGGYILGMKEMVYMSRGADLVRRFGAVVVSPGYRLAWQSPYPSALLDCYEALTYMHAHADTLGYQRDRLFVGGESAGGGLAIAVCMKARDEGEIPIAYQFPLYPMISCVDTASSGNNHGKVWNTRRNHLGWHMYLRSSRDHCTDPYASPSMQTEYAGLPPCYTFVGSGEPFYCETLAYVQKLQDAGIEASLDVYPTNVHAFDMMRPNDTLSGIAIERFHRQVAHALSRNGSEETMP